MIKQSKFMSGCKALGKRTHRRGEGEYRGGEGGRREGREHTEEGREGRKYTEEERKGRDAINFFIVILNLYCIIVCHFRCNK